VPEFGEVSNVVGHVPNHVGHGVNVSISFAVVFHCGFLLPPGLLNGVLVDHAVLHVDSEVLFGTNNEVQVFAWIAVRQDHGVVALLHNAERAFLVALPPINAPG